jgi:hypothetical protein
MPTLAEQGLPAAYQETAPGQGSTRERQTQRKAKRRARAGAGRRALAVPAQDVNAPAR